VSIHIAKDMRSGLTRLTVRPLSVILVALSQRERVIPLVIEQKPYRFISVGLLYV